VAVGATVVGEAVTGEAVMGEAVTGDVVTGEVVGEVDGEVVTGEVVGATVIGEVVGEVVGVAVTGETVGEVVGEDVGAYSSKVASAANAWSVWHWTVAAESRVTVIPVSTHVCEATSQDLQTFQNPVSASAPVIEAVTGSVRLVRAISTPAAVMKLRAVTLLSIVEGSPETVVAVP
jgi:hypothetical protein